MTSVILSGVSPRLPEEACGFSGALPLLSIWQHQPCSVSIWVMLHNTSVMKQYLTIMSHGWENFNEEGTLVKLIISPQVVSDWLVKKCMLGSSNIGSYCV